VLQHAQANIAAAHDQQLWPLPGAQGVQHGERWPKVGRGTIISSKYPPDPPMSLTVTLKPAERSFTVERDERILAAAIRQGIGLPYGCRDGACGSCKCRLLEGRVIHGAHQQKALSTDEEAAGFILTCCATPQSDCVVEARSVPGAGDFPILKLPSRVLSVDKPCADVAVLKLQLPANQNLQYRAGQYVEFILRDGARRSYSMANAPHLLGTPPAIELHIRHMPGGKFTDHVFSGLKEKDILRMEGPFGSFFLREASDKPLVLLASGTGFAPIKALIEHMEFKSITRPAVLYWGCRSKADLYLHEWAEAAAARLPHLRYVPVLSEPKPEDGWTGRTGFVHQAVMADLPDLSGHQVYACGAPVMVESAERDFTAHCGLPGDEFFADSFTSAADQAG
jgi:CDP-4-dehydro-6-deoxyglucose reductase